MQFEIQCCTVWQKYASSCINLTQTGKHNFPVWGLVFPHSDFDLGETPCLYLMQI
jgi:hypothetical protein